jgi:tetratricopeptide (TPR) repeat protein
MKWLALVASLVVLASTPASAQSKRYPPEPVDKDDEAAAKSKLWDAASNPQRSPYNDLVKEAEEGLRDKSDDGAKDAVGRLDQAIKLMPDDDKAYRLRGEAHMLLKDWTRCAADYQHTLARLKRADGDLRSSIDIRRRLGLCQARSGKLADAERTLAEAAASGAGNGEVWMRLGEVRIAMGKLDEAITALEAATEMGDVSQALVRWLLAGAYDRARKPSDATKVGVEALKSDRELSTLKSTAAVPLLGTGESEYLTGLAYGVFDPPRPEYSILYFRRFLKVAPDSPWRRRAEDHLRELKSAELPEFVEKRGGNALFEVVQARVAVRKLITPLRACMAKLPNVIMEITVTKSGPRTPVTVGTRRSHQPPEGVTILPTVNIDGTSKADIDGATRCMEPIGEKLKATLPAIKDKDAYYKAAFSVVAP